MSRTSWDRDSWFGTRRISLVRSRTISKYFPILCSKSWTLNIGEFEKCVCRKYWYWFPQFSNIFHTESISWAASDEANRISWILVLSSKQQESNRDIETLEMEFCISGPVHIFKNKACNGHASTFNSIEGLQSIFWEPEIDILVLFNSNHQGIKSISLKTRIGQFSSLLFNSRNPYIVPHPYPHPPSRG